MTRQRPPRFASALLDRVLPKGTVGRSIRGDLDQEFSERRAKRRSAGVWYVVEALKLTIRYGLGRSSRSISTQHMPYGAHRVRSLVDSIGNDLAHGIRLLRRKPLIAVVSILTLGLGIGVNAAVFAVVDSILIRPLPFTNPDRVARVFAHDPGTGDRYQPATVYEYEHYREHTTAFEDLAAYSIAPRHLMDGATDPRTLSIGRATWNLFDVLGVTPVLGRAFREADSRSGERVALLTYGFWRATYGGTPSALGHTIAIGQEPYTVIGVLPQPFDHPPDLALWRPLTDDEYRDDDRELTIVGRLATGATLLTANRELGMVAAGLREQDPERAAAAVHVEPFHQAMVRTVRTPLLTIWAAVGCVLLIACTNLAGIQLAHQTARQAELAIRTALGAGRGRLARQVLTEGIVMAVPAAAVGIAAGYVALAILLGLVPGDMPRLVEVRLDLRVTIAMLALALVSAGAVGIIPAWRVTRSSLRAHGVGTQHRTTRPAMQYGLVAGQLAVSTVLAVGAALLLDSFSRQMDFDRGFESSNLLAVTVDPLDDFGSASSGLEFLERLIARVEAIPAVTDATMASTSPMNPLGFRARVSVPGITGDRNRVNVLIKVMFEDLFEVTRTPLLAGRSLAATDQRDTETVMVVNQAFARALGSSDEHAVDRVTESGLGRVRIVGVVRDIQAAASQPVEPTVYVSYRQLRVPGGVLLLRTRAPLETIAPSIRNILREMDPTMPLNRFTSIEEEIGETVAQPRFNALIVGLFAALSILLAAVGAFGVTADVVRRRYHEMGVRHALGATGSQLIWSVFAAGLRMVAVGGTVGLIAAYWMSRLLSSLLFGMQASSVLMAASAVATLAAASLLACYIPSRRCAHVSPVTALRDA
jgi:predicted permease